MAEESITEINLIVELEDEQSVNEDTARSIQERIGKLDIVKEVEAVVETPEQVRALTGLEVVAAIGVTVAIVKGGRQLLEEGPKVLKAIEAILKGWKGVKKAYLDLGKRRVPIDEVEPKDLEAVVARSARPLPVSRDSKRRLAKSSAPSRSAAMKKR